MKNVRSILIISISILILIFVNGVKTYAQKFEFGLRLMPTFSSFEIFTPGTGRIRSDFKLGYGFGGLLGFNFNDNIGIQGEIIYSGLAQRYTESSFDRKIELRYLNIPLLLSLNTGKTKSVNLNIVGGPQIGVSAGSRLLTTGGDGPDNSNPILSVKKGDLGFAFGAGLDFAINPAKTFRFCLGYRGVVGLIDISNNNNTVLNDYYYVLDRSRIRSNAIYLGVSFLF